MFLWIGKGSFAWEQELGREFARNFARERENHAVRDEKEGSESKEFWSTAFKSSTPLLDYSNDSFWTRRLDSLKFAAENSSILPFSTRLWEINFIVNGNPSVSELHDGLAHVVRRTKLCHSLEVTWMKTASSYSTRTLTCIFGLDHKFTMLQSQLQWTRCTPIFQKLLHQSHK